MTLYLFSPTHEPLKPIPHRGWIEIDGDRISGLTAGWVHERTGHYVQDYTPPPPPEPDPAEVLAEWRDNAETSQFQAHYMLKQWSIYAQAQQIADAAGDPIAMAFSLAGVWRRRSAAIEGLFDQITLADGTTATAEDLDEFFRQAMQVVV